MFKLMLREKSALNKQPIEPTSNISQILKLSCLFGVFADTKKKCVIGVKNRHYSKKNCSCLPEKRKKSKKIGLLLSVVCCWPTNKPNNTFWMMILMVVVVCSLPFLLLTQFVSVTSFDWHLREWFLVFGRGEGGEFFFLPTVNVNVSVCPSVFTQFGWFTLVVVVKFAVFLSYLSKCTATPHTHTHCKKCQKAASVCFV